MPDVCPALRLHAVVPMMVARRTFGEAVVAVAAVGKDRTASDHDQAGRGMMCEQRGGKEEERENGGDTHVGVLADGLR